MATQTQTEAKAKEGIVEGVEADTQAQIDSVLEADKAGTAVSEDEAMYAFSQAVSSGVNVMDLPDPVGKPEVAALDDQNSMAVFQESMASQTSDPVDPTMLPQPAKPSGEEPQTIVGLAAEYASEIQAAGMEMEKKEERPQSIAQVQAQAALDEVKIVLPAGMSMEVKTRKEAPAPRLGEDGQSDPDALIQQYQESQEQNGFRKAPSGGVLNQVQSEAQNALDYVAPRDPTDISGDVQETQYKAEAVVTQVPQHDVFDQQNYDGYKEYHAWDDTKIELQSDDHRLEEAPKTEGCEAVSNAQAAIDQVQVKQVSSKTNSYSDQEQRKQEEQPIQPKSVVQTQTESKTPESDIERSIRLAEQAQVQQSEEGTVILEDNQEKLEKQISGSNNLWGGQVEVEHMSGKLTRPKGFKTQAQIQQEQKGWEKAEKQRIRDEILGTVAVSDVDTRLFSDNLALQSTNSKSDIELEAERQYDAAEKEQKEQDNRAKLAKIQEQNEKLQKKLREEESAQLRRAEAMRVEKKNNRDMASVHDLKALEQLQSSASSSQFSSLADAAAIDEQNRMQQQEVDDGANLIQQQAVRQYEEQHTQARPKRQRTSTIQRPAAPPIPRQQLSVKVPIEQKPNAVSQLASKLGVSYQPSDSKLQSKERIASAMVERALQSGKTQAQIAAAMQ